MYVCMCVRGPYACVLFFCMCVCVSWVCVLLTPTLLGLNGYTHTIAYMEVNVNVGNVNMGNRIEVSRSAYVLYAHMQVHAQEATYYIERHIL